MGFAEKKSALVIGGRGEFGQFLQQDILPILGTDNISTIELAKLTRCAARAEVAQETHHQVFRARGLCRNQREFKSECDKSSLRRSEMFIASSTTKDRAPFGGAECYSMNTCQLEFRPSERRRMDGASPAYKHFTPTGLPLGHTTWLLFTLRNLLKKTRS